MVTVLRRKTAGCNHGVAGRTEQSLISSTSDIFDPQSPGEPRFWTCVRTRPRWEKKFVGWLRGHHHHFFLPTVAQTSVSGRKRRQTEIPLFPGYVFVDGDHVKGDFDRTGIVVYVLRPQCEHEIAQLHCELWSVWCGLTSGLYVTPIQNLAVGEFCEIIRGPLQGVRARFERMGKRGRLVLQVDMMGCGLAVEVGNEEVKVCL